MCRIYHKETLEYLATNCTEDTRNNERANQILGEKRRNQLDEEKKFQS